MAAYESVAEMRAATIAQKRKRAAVLAAVELASGLAGMAMAPYWNGMAARAERYAQPGNMHSWFAGMWRRKARAWVFHLEAARLYGLAAVGR